MRRLAGLLMCAGMTSAMGAQVALPSAPPPQVSSLASTVPPGTVAGAGGVAAMDGGPAEASAATGILQSRPDAGMSPDQDPGAVAITRTQAEELALKNNPRITAAHLLALAAGEVTREARSAELPHVDASMTAVKAEDGNRIGAGGMNSSRLYTHAGTGGTLSQLVTDFGRTRNLVANAKLRAKAQQQSAQATEQDVLLTTDEAFYRLVNAQSLLEVARATVRQRSDVESVIRALTKSALKSELDLSVAEADRSQAELLELDARNGVASASAALVALLAAPDSTEYRAVDDGTAPPLPPEFSASLLREAQAQRPDLEALRLNVQAESKFTRAQADQYLPTISAQAIGGATPVRPDSGFGKNWYAAAGVNLSLPIFTGFRISAETAEARLRQQATEKQAADLSNSITRDLRVATLAAQTAYQRIRVTEAFRSETAQALSLAQTRYRLGLSSIVELSKAQLESTQAAVAAVNARYDYLLALRSLDYTRGRLAP